MKRKAKKPGGRLRLTLLLVSAAALLLVPASQALANGTMKALGSGAGSGEISSVNGNGGEEGPGDFIGTPPIECDYNGNTETTSGVCENEQEAKEGLEGVALSALPAPGSELVGWEVKKGGAFALGCGPKEKLCLPAGFEGENAEFEVAAIFAPCAEGSTLDTCVSTMTVNIEGSGAGEVVGTTFGPIPAGKPKMECSYASPGPAAGVCVNTMVAETEAEEISGEGIRIDTLKAVPAVGSKFVGWTVQKGSGLELSCGPEPFVKPTCVFYVLSLGLDAEVTAEFEKEPVKQPLTLTTSGGEGGTFQCKDLTVGGSFASCVSGATFGENDEVEVKAVPNTGSVFAAWTGCDSEPSGNCVVKMTEPGRSVNAQFDLKTFTLTAEAFGEGEVTAPGITCTEAGNGSSACEEEFAYGTNVLVTATPEALNSVGSLLGNGSAKESCSLPGPEEAGTCEFEIKAISGVSAEFVAAESIESKSANVHGFVPQNTTLEFTEDVEGNTCADVDLGTFLANLQENHTYAKTCGLIVTATGAVNVLSASDESVGADKGHLTNSSYELPEPLETQAEGIPTLLFPGEGGGTLASLESVVDLLTYNGPVNSDNVTLEFSQLIKEHDPLYTGEYSKQIVLTLEQTAL
jgi:Divergent InlB B-repeat domain